MNPPSLTSIGKYALPSTVGSWLPPELLLDSCPPGTQVITLDALEKLGIQVSGHANYCVSSMPGTEMFQTFIQGNPATITHSSLLEVSLDPGWVVSATQLCRDLVEKFEGANPSQCISMLDFVKNVDWGSGVTHTLADGATLPLNVTPSGGFVYIDHGPYFNDPAAKALGDYLQIPIEEFINAFERALMSLESANAKDVYEILKNTPMTHEAAEYMLQSTQTGLSAVTLVLIIAGITVSVVALAPDILRGLQTLGSKVKKK
jgi:hypothetical protein